MFELFRKIFRGFYAAYLSALLIMLALILPGAALVNFCWQLLDDRRGEIGTAFVQLVIACVVVAFIFWVRRDITSRAEHLPRKSSPPKAEDCESIDDENDDNPDRTASPKTPPSDQIQPWPRKDDM